MYQLATAPRGIGQVLDSVFKLTRIAWVRMLPYAIFAAILGAAPIVYLMQTGIFADPARLVAEGIPGSYWILVAVVSLASMLLYGAGVARIESIAQGDDIGLGRSFGVAVPKMGTLLLSAILFGLAVGVGLILLIVPGLFLLGSLFLFVPAIMLDGKGPVEGLNYSHKLVWGNWWRVATTFTIAVIIIYVVYLIGAIVVGMVLGFASVAVDPAAGLIANLIVTVVASLLVTAFFYALYVEIYRDVKMRKTGGDLAQRIAAVGTAR